MTSPALRIDPPSWLADPALRKVLAALPGARLVGGVVRDLLAGLGPPADIDLATPMPPEAVVAALAAAGLKSAPTGMAHGTVTAIADGRGFEVTTLRRDVATDGRHAVVAFTDDWRVDAGRRDFTINAMSMTPDGAIYDDFGGVADLKARLVRFVGPAASRIAEDYLRILRFFRFHARHGGASPDAEAVAAIRAGVPGLAQLSVERVWSELKRILQAPDPRPSLLLMQQLGVLDAVLPEGADPGRMPPDLPPDPLLRLAGLLTGDAAAASDRLRMSAAERARLVALRGAAAPAWDGDDDALRRALADTPRDVLLGRAWLEGAAPALRARLSALPVPVFPVQGRDLLEAGVAPGPAMGALLAVLRAWWLQGGCRAGRDACLAELASLRTSSR